MYVTLIDHDYYEVIDNSECNAPDDYILIELGPHTSYDELISMPEELPF